VRSTPILAILVLFATNTPASAGKIIDWVNGNKLWEWCKTGSNSTLCLGYAAGIADAMSANENSILGWHACFRQEITIGQLADVVKLYLSNHPEKRDYASSGLVGQAFENAFPCPK
jgi:hypothetical protein